MTAPSFSCKQQLRFPVIHSSVNCTISMRIETDGEFTWPSNCLILLGYILQGELLQNSSALYISITSLREQAFFLGTSHMETQTSYHLPTHT